MAVIVKYVVERNGEEKMTFASKSEADAYDKMLDVADELEVMLKGSGLLENDDNREAVAMFLAENKDDLLQALKGKKKAPVVKPAPKAAAKKSVKAA
ncbi:YebG family protein [Ferrimonas aestuarii]|uniref:Multidrug DMT transporter permease n=1 Tax=Ferrimonas aestuarii TaxID=2569539 RepID=A0A4U1BHX0_9GAMM|nr:YebG family protein [Ferrimonas aestuarii]TKB49649.1 multidrug DMT transporter permease [Ferrimonas aestuarii]